MGDLDKEKKPDMKDKVGVRGCCHEAPEDCVLNVLGKPGGLHLSHH